MRHRQPFSSIPVNPEIVRGSGPNGSVHEGMFGLTGVREPGVALGPFVQMGENEYYFTVICHAAGAIPEQNAHAELKWVGYTSTPDLSIRMQ